MKELVTKPSGPIHSIPWLLSLEQSLNKRQKCQFTLLSGRRRPKHIKFWMFNLKNLAKRDIYLKVKTSKFQILKKIFWYEIRILDTFSPSEFLIRCWNKLNTHGEIAIASTRPSMPNVDIILLPFAHYPLRKKNLLGKHQ